MLTTRFSRDAGYRRFRNTRIHLCSYLSTLVSPPEKRLLLRPPPVSASPMPIQCKVSLLARGWNGNFHNDYRAGLKHSRDLRGCFD